MLYLIVTALLAMCQMVAAASVPIKDPGGKIAPKVLIVSMVSDSKSGQDRQLA
jgi:hypothetical protein